jgi:predicted transposase/invertase (TIGR01784 family)
MSAPSSLHHPHDAFFKASMQDVGIAQDFFKAHLSSEIQARMNFATLRLTDKSFVTPDMAQIHSDLIYQVQLDQKKAYVYVLLEHQSTPHALLPFRRLQYNVALMDLHLKQGYTTLPVIISLCVYHGTHSPYPHSMNIFDLFEDHALARKYSFENYQLIDLTIMPEEKLDEGGLSMLMCALLKCAYEKDFITAFKKMLQKETYAVSVQKYDEFYLVKVLQYVNEMVRTDARELAQQILSLYVETIPKDKREYVMNIREHLELIGYEKGIEQGIEQGIGQGIEKGREEGIESVAIKMLQLGQPHSFIQQVTSFSLDEIKKLAKKAV